MRFADFSDDEFDTECSQLAEMYALCHEPLYYYYYYFYCLCHISIEVSGRK